MQAELSAGRLEAQVRLKILVLEDDAIQADIIAHMIEAEGCYAEIARTGRGAVRRICGGIFDAALIDYQVPDIDGLSVVKAIKAMTPAETRPVLIALTALADELLERSAIGADFSAVCRKPVSAQSLMMTIEQCVATARATRNGPASIGAAGPGVDRAPAPVKWDNLSNGHERDRILLADDDEQLRGLMQQVFEGYGYEVDVARNGLEAVELISLKPYHVALIDYHMPELDGLAAAKIIYDRSSRQERPRLIALTSAPDSLVAHDAQWQLVFDDIVPKGLGLAVILSTVQKCRDYKMLRAEAPVEVLDLRTIARF